MIEIYTKIHANEINRAGNVGVQSLANIAT